MRSLLAAVAFAAGFAAVAHAGDKPAPLPSAVVMSRDDCRHMVQYHPAPDVAYKPGVDVHGKAVAPADLDPGANNGAPKQIVIDLHAFLGQVSASNVPTGLGQSFVNTGQVTIDLDDGSVSMNGHKLGADADSAIAEACRKAGVN